MIKFYRHPLLFVFSLFFAMAGAAQNFSLPGRVTDSLTGKPVHAASVFLSNTSSGTVTDSGGMFLLKKLPKGRFNLVVSSLGYETFVKSINTAEGEYLHISLVPKTNSLKEVVVGTYEKDGWSKWGKVFTDNFIGSQSLAVECIIKNPEEIKFRYSKKRDVLEAFADGPLLIENSGLGYIVHYKLDAFSLDMGSQRLFYEGYPLFEEMPGNERKQKMWKGRRKDAYYGSVMHFMRCLYINKLEENGYEIRRLEKIPNTEKVRIQLLTANRGDDFETGLPQDTLKYYKKVLNQPDEREILHAGTITADSIAHVADSATVAVEFNNYLVIAYTFKKEPFEYLQQSPRENSLHGYITSQISLLNARPLNVLYNGNYYEVPDMFTTGYWAWSEKIVTMLPFDYWP